VRRHISREGHGQRRRRAPVIRICAPCEDQPGTLGRRRHNRTEVLGMSYCFIMDFDDGGADAYDATNEDMELHGQLPPGALFHSAGATETGWRVVDVWETAEAFESFAATKIGPLGGKNGFSPPRIQSFEVRSTRTSEGARPTFVQVVRIPVDEAGFDELDTLVTGPEREVPAGCIYHVNGPLGDGWCVMDAWSSKEVRDEFMATKVAPSAQAAGLTAPPEVDELPLHNTLLQSDVRASV
jgi:hypothetical protein